MEIVKKLINFTIAILAILVCFQIISTNNNKLFLTEDDGISEYRTNIVTTIESKKRIMDYNSVSTEMKTE